MEWTIYRLPSGGEVTRYFSSIGDAEDFRDRVAGNPGWAGAIMRSSTGIEWVIG